MTYQEFIEVNKYKNRKDNKYLVYNLSRYELFMLDMTALTFDTSDPTIIQKLFMLNDITYD